MMWVQAVHPDWAGHRNNNTSFCDQSLHTFEHLKRSHCMVHCAAAAPPVM
jgi:hypothetical protein